MRSTGRIGPIWLGALAVTVVVALVGGGCGSRSGLGLWWEDGAGGAGAASNGAGGPAEQCAAVGEECAAEEDCCDAVCTDGACRAPPSPCVDDESPVLLATGLSDPYALGGNATSLFMGELAAARPLLRIPKAGGSAEVLIDAVSFVDHLLVREGTVFFSEEAAVSAVPVKGGPKKVLANASGPAGLDVTAGYVYFADYEAGQLVRIDRQTLETKVLGSQALPGIHRVAQIENANLVYFSSSTNGVRRYHLDDGWFDSIDIDTPPARAVRLWGEMVYFTVPSIAHVYRVGVLSVDTELVADLSPLGVYPEALETDGTSLYLTLETGTDSGLIVRVPIEGGEVEIIADAQGPRPSALVVDDTCVYWTERATGSLYRARKDPSP